MSLGVTDIPPELLGDIFSLCAQYCPDAPVILSVVCKRFRAIALGTPRAWTSLRLCVSREGEREVIRKAGLWLSLAGACCVGLYIDIEGQTAAFAESHPFLIAFLQHHTERIGSLNVRSQTEYAAHSFLNAIYCPLPFSPSPSQLPLKALRIRISGPSPGLPASSAAMSVFHSLELLPQLKSLQLTNHLLPSVYTPDLHNLLSLSVIRPLKAPPITLSQLIQIVEAAPHLIELEISARVASDSVSTEFHLPHLKRLSLRTNRVPLLLETFIAPSLEELHINDLDGKRHAASDELISSFQHLTRNLMSMGTLDWPLRTLEVEGVSFHWEAESMRLWEWCLARMKKLDDFSFTSTDDDFGRFVDLLVDDGAVCPALRTLRLGGFYSLGHGDRLQEARHGLEVILNWSSHERPRQPLAPGIGKGLGFGSRFAIKHITDGGHSHHHTSTFKGTKFVLTPELEKGW